MKKVNIFTILAIVSLLVGYFCPTFTGNNIDGIVITNLITSILAVGFAIASIVYAKKIEKSKVFGIILLVLGILEILIFAILFAFMTMARDPEKSAEFCKTVVSCEKGSDNVSTCYLEADSSKILPIKCYDSNLNANQYK